MKQKKNVSTFYQRKIIIWNSILITFFFAIKFVMHEVKTKSNGAKNKAKPIVWTSISTRSCLAVQKCYISNWLHTQKVIRTNLINENLLGEGAQSHHTLCSVMINKFPQKKNRFNHLVCNWHFIFRCNVIFRSCIPNLLIQTKTEEKKMYKHKRWNWWLFSNESSVYL